MYKKDFLQIINSNNLSNFYLLRGVENYEIEYFTNKLISLKKHYSITKFFYEFNLDDCINALMPSLFCNNSMLIIKHNKTIPTKDIKKLINLCKNDKNVFFIYALEEISKTPNDFIKAFEGNDVRFFKPNNEFEAVKILSLACDDLGIKYSPSALERIYKIHNENLSLAFNEIKKFSDLGIEINDNNVKKMVFDLSEVSISDLIDKILSKKDFRDDFFKCTQSGNFNEVVFISYLYAQVYRIFKIHMSLKSMGSINFIQTLGYNPPVNIANKLKSEALSFKTNEFFEIFKILNECEFNIKTNNNLDKEINLLSNLLKLQSIIIK